MPVDTAQSAEPLLVPDSTRFVMFPIVHRDLWALYKKSEACIWTAEEIDLGKDRFDDLTPGEQRFVKHVLAFFAASDGIVNENLALNFSTEVCYAEARAFYAVQIFIETVHRCVREQSLDGPVRNAMDTDTTDPPAVRCTRC